jgi:hypothetical protein
MNRLGATLRQGGREILSNAHPEPYEPPVVEEIDACGDPVKTSPMISVNE